ncbi:translation initiation factor IF-2-like [Mirounga leonina]|uniref:translation initiation factor IF-2-like n=1 Tax=Mirounga leonina TaxID=9715 RepID=UPI00156C25E4|nr:translation initiation factor IF-2-like [Mirounga leonina]
MQGACPPRSGRARCGLSAHRLLPVHTGGGGAGAQTQGIAGGPGLEWRVLPAPVGTGAGRGLAEAPAGLGCPGHSELTARPASTAEGWTEPEFLAAGSLPVSGRRPEPAFSLKSWGRERSHGVHVLLSAGRAHPEKAAIPASEGRPQWPAPRPGKERAPGTQPGEELSGGVGPGEGTQVWTHADGAGEFCRPEPGSRALWQGVGGGRFSCSSRLRVTGGNIGKLHRVVSGR